MANKEQRQAESFFDFDFTKFLSDYRVPGVDMQSMVDTQRKNIEALTAANRTAYDGFQAVVARQADFMRQSMEEMVRATQEMTTPGDAQDKAAKQAELIRQAFERSLAILREMADMVAKSNADAFDLLNKRFTQNMEELRNMMTAAR